MHHAKLRQLTAERAIQQLQRPPTPSCLSPSALGLPWLLCAFKPAATEYHMNSNNYEEPTTAALGLTGLPGAKTGTFVNRHHSTSTETIQHYGIQFVSGVEAHHSLQHQLLLLMTDMPDAGLKQKAGLQRAYTAHRCRRTLPMCVHTRTYILVRSHLGRCVCNQGLGSTKQHYGS